MKLYYFFINPGVSWVSLLKIPLGRWWRFCSWCSGGPSGWRGNDNVMHCRKIKRQDIVQTCMLQSLTFLFSLACMCSTSNSLARRSNSQASLTFGGWIDTENYCNVCARALNHLYRHSILYLPIFSSKDCRFVRSDGCCRRRPLLHIYCSESR